VTYKASFVSALWGKGMRVAGGLAHRICAPHQL